MTVPVGALRRTATRVRSGSHGSAHRTAPDVQRLAFRLPRSASCLLAQTRRASRVVVRSFRCPRSLGTGGLLAPLLAAWDTGRYLRRLTRPSPRKTPESPGIGSYPGHQGCTEWQADSAAGLRSRPLISDRSSSAGFASLREHAISEVHAVCMWDGRLSHVQRNLRGASRFCSRRRATESSLFGSIQS